MTQQQYKVCPRCDAQAAATAPSCPQCAHAYPVNTVPPQDSEHSRISEAPPLPHLNYQQHPELLVAEPGMIQVRQGTHRVGTAILINLLLTGAGQMYNKQVAKGFALLLAAVGISIITNGIGGIGVLIFCMVDAGKVGARLNRGEAVGKWQFF